MNKTKKREWHAKSFILDLKTQTSIEGLTALLQEYRKTESFGKNSHICQQAFANRYVELANTEAEILVGILSFRDGWREIHYRYEWSLATWKIVEYIKDYFVFNHVECEQISRWRKEAAQHGQEINEIGFRDSWNHHPVTYEIKIEPLEAHTEDHPKIREVEVEVKHPSVTKQISGKYDLSFIVKPEIRTEASVALMRKLSSFTAAKLVYQVNHNNESGKILLEKMFEYAKTKGEIFFVMQSMFGSKNNPKGYKKELKILTKKFLSLL